MGLVAGLSILDQLHEMVDGFGQALVGEWIDVG